jgi:hypothetical protein
MARRLAAIALALLLCAGFAACGEEDEPSIVDEDELRGCLTGEGLKMEAPDLSSTAALGSSAPDFRALTAEGTAVDLVVLGTERKAERAAIDIRAARAGLGGGGEVVVHRNAIAVFDATPTEGSRSTVERCLAAQD